MTLNRRDLLTGLGTVAAGAAFGKLTAQAPAAATFPRKADFTIAQGVTYISGAFTHPMPIAAAQAYRDAVNRRVTRITALAEELVAQRAEDRVGETLEVLVESIENGAVEGRAADGRRGMS